jgi:hypothetical protein
MASVRVAITRKERLVVVLGKRKINTSVQHDEAD